ncbi:adenosylcobinamide amidohydrolase [Catellatospora bangladeshensis]|uniref:Adenosylcobinamide amidohydrolase n=1 Tax=Catellatospora bangladeshensis TaxID=310355 RepID=A0A8J3NHV0_9ACTN|nr:adenosylcobinamide amidohydrolase [Catellatospora bangladeshensis]GIF81790.1 adenosylcobinamide amidohydrolase [Catellatospora bangladeshensis]
MTSLPRLDANLLRPDLVRHGDGAAASPALLWRAGAGWRMISSAVLGGGLGEREWVLNAQVGHGYTRMDPDRHLAEIAREHGLSGPGVGLMTAARVAEGAHADDGGAEAVVTAGIGVCGWAADPVAVPQQVLVPGTINVIVAVPVALSDAALVNAVATATEAKVQALRDAGFDASGTPTDAVCVAAWRAGELTTFAGPRSEWGSRLARAVHAATYEAAARYRDRRLSQ